MTKKLVLGPKISLPLDAVTETFGILAVRGAGKSNTAAVMAEEMFANHLPFVVIDPVGSWWGLRSSSNGKGPGLSIPIFGGKHGDIPLERGGGQVVADLVVDENLSLILDLSTFESESAKKQFLLDFAKRLYQRNESPLHLFLEEADDYIPQRPMRDEALLLRAFENIVRRGRARGLGITLITQRSASLNKNVLTQVQTLIAMRTTGPQDRNAIHEWVKYHALSQKLLESLPSLESGEAWVWSPDFLKQVKLVKIRRRKTFDSGATPKHAAVAARQPKTLADVDLKKVHKLMSATVERAKQTDPKALQQENARLTAELKRANTFNNERQPAKEVEKRVEVPVIKDAQIKRLEKVAERLVKGQNNIAELVGELRAIVTRKPTAAQTADSYRRVPTYQPVKKERPEGMRVEKSAEMNGKLPGGEKEILGVAAQFPKGATRQQLTVITGYKRSTRDAYVSRLLARQYVAIDDGKVVATGKGIAAIGSDYQPLPEGSALRQYWLEKLPEGESQILSLLCQYYPENLGNDFISENTGYKRSTRDAYLSRLQARQLITRSHGFAKAAKELFDE
jgi:hypothetical protein